jgi:hypothetical protein
MLKKFLRLFKEYRELEKDLERQAALADSFERYIEALEGRDLERLIRIADLEATLAVQQKLASELREHLSGMLPEQ